MGNIGNLLSLGKKSNTLLGVDISSSSIKIVELSGTGEKLKLENYVIRSLPVDAVVEKNINDVDAVSECISDALSILKPRRKDSAVAVAASAVITKTIAMNAVLSDSEMENQIVVEADQYIPYPLDEVSIDFERQQLSKSSSDLVEVLLAACRRENVDTRVTALENSGLVAKVIDIEAYAIERAFSLIDKQLRKEDEQTVAIVDVGSTMTTLNVMFDGKAIYNRELTFGGRQLVEQVQQRFGLNALEAENSIKRGTLPEEYGRELLAPFKEKVAQQVTQTLQFFFSSSHYNEVDCIVLAGGVAAAQGIAQLVGDNLATDVVVANPFTYLAIGNKINKTLLANDAPSLLIATGLAMRGSY